MLNNRHGVALIATLWILAVLVIMAAGMAVMVRTETQISHNYSALIQCRWAARAGINRALIELDKLKDQQTTYLGESGLTLSSQSDEIDLGDASFNVIIEDEAGKININAAPSSILQQLFDDPDIADCIIDWRDSDDQPRPLGAEGEYYQGLTPPYNCKNKPFDTVKELLLVKGMTPEMLSSPVTQTRKTWADLLTVYSYDKNTAVDGSARINIQTASKDDLKAAFGDTLTDQDIDAIIRQRESRAFAKAAEVIRVPTLGRDKVMKIYDRITVVGGSNNSSGPSNPNGNPNPNGGPPPNGRQMPSGPTSPPAPTPSNNSAATLAGRININTAQAEVLAGLPGMDESIAQEIVSYRQSSGAFSDVGQLLNVTGVTDDAFVQSAEYLTVRSKVFRIVATGRVLKDNIAGTITCVVDLSGQSPQIKYWRE